MTPLPAPAIESPWYHVARPPWEVCERPTTVHDTSPATDASDEEVSLLALANVLLRYRGLVIGTAVALTLVVAVATLLVARTFTTHATLTPQSRRSTTTLTGLASQFGLALPLADGGQSPAFYADLLTSHHILGAVVDTKFEFPTDTGSPAGP